MRNFWFSRVLIATALIVATATSCSKAPQQQMAAEYATLTIEGSDRVISTSYSAIIEGLQDVAIYPQVSGTITKELVTEGKSVKKGETIFIIDQVPYEAALATAKANVASAKAALASAQLQYDSKVILLQENVISQYDLTTSENALLVAKANLQQAEAAELSASNNLSYTVVKSPSNGVVGELPYRVGALISASMSQPLTTVSDNSNMSVFFSMTENQLLNLIRSYGSKEDVLKNMPIVKLQLNDKSIYPVDGKIVSISGVIDRTTGSARVKAIFSNENELLHSGGTGRVILPTEVKDKIVIPQIATFEVQDKVFAYRVIDGKASTTLIEVENINGGVEYLVKSGLEKGDVILAEGVGVVREGMPITPKSKAPESK